MRIEHKTQGRVIHTEVRSGQKQNGGTWEIATMVISRSYQSFDGRVVDDFVQVQFSGDDVRELKSGKYDKDGAMAEFTITNIRSTQSKDGRWFTNVMASDLHEYQYQPMNAEQPQSPQTGTRQSAIGQTQVPPPFETPSQPTEDDGTIPQMPNDGWGKIEEPF